MDQWKESFLSKLNRAQSQWVSRFDEALDDHFVPEFEEIKQFLGDNGFRVSTPLHEPGQRSFKFELAENAYLLMILRSVGVGEFELRSEVFAPGKEPELSKMTARANDLTREWVSQQLQSALDTFVDLLGGESAAPTEELVECAANAV